MRVRCLNNEYSCLPDNITKNMSPSDFPIDIGCEYNVYAISEFYGFIWFCILDRNSDTSPMWYPSVFFEIIDSRLSRYWIFSFFENSLKKGKRPFFGFPEWAVNIEFYSDLVEGESEEIELFQRYRKAMDLEFPDKSVTVSAQIGDEKWLICPDCMDAWEYSDAKDALVICPICHQKFNNPRYMDGLPHL